MVTCVQQSVRWRPFSNDRQQKNLNWWKTLSWMAWNQRTNSLQGWFNLLQCLVTVLALTNTYSDAQRPTDGFLLSCSLPPLLKLPKLSWLHACPEIPHEWTLTEHRHAERLGSLGHNRLSVCLSVSFSLPLYFPLPVCLSVCLSLSDWA